MYNELYKAWKSEKTSRETQPLSNDFYQRAENYLRSLEEEKGPVDEHSANGRLTLKEKEVVSRLLSELKEARLRKLLAITQNGESIDQANLTEEETKLVKDLDMSLRTFNQHKLKPETGSPDVAETVELSVVRFLQDIPEIVGTDLRIYGPYKREDVGSLPLQNAKALAMQGAAKQIEVRGIVKPDRK